MPYLVRPHGVDKIGGRMHLIKYKGEEMSVSQLALATEQTQPSVSRKLKMVINGELSYFRLVSNISLAAKIVKVNRKWLTVPDICEITGWSAPKIIKRIDQYENGKITVKELLEPKPETKVEKQSKSKTRNAHLLKYEMLGKGEESFEPEEYDREADYVRKLRIHKLNTAPVYGGMK